MQCVGAWMKSLALPPALALQRVLARAFALALALAFACSVPLEPHMHAVQVRARLR